jgi:hypothetical protein
MKQQEASANSKKLTNEAPVQIEVVLTREQDMKIMSYPSVYQGTLRECARKGASIEEVYEDIKEFDKMM